MQFTAIKNVHNGPGEGALPNAEYSAAIEALNSLNNVRTIGYVATAWCTRGLSSVLDDVAALSFWGEYDSSLAVSGIFVDETPVQYSSDYASYLETVAQAVEGSVGLRESYIGKLTSLAQAFSHPPSRNSDLSEHLAPPFTLKASFIREMVFGCTIGLACDCSPAVIHAQG